MAVPTGINTEYEAGQVFFKPSIDIPPPGIKTAYRPSWHVFKTLHNLAGDIFIFSKNINI